METWHVVIDPGSLPPDDVIARLGQLGLPRRQLDVQVRRPAETFRTDAAMVVAVIGAVSSNLAVVLTGLMQLLAGRSTQRIVLETADGRRIDVPAGTPADQIDAYLKRLESPPNRLILP